MEPRMKQIPPEYDIFLKYQYRDRDIGGYCNAYVYGCCEIHIGCAKIQTSNDTYLLSYQSIPIETEIKIDPQGSNCPGLGELMSNSVNHCSINQACDMVRQFPHNSPVEYYDNLISSNMYNESGKEEYTCLRNMIDDYNKVDPHKFYVLLVFGNILLFVIMSFTCIMIDKENSQKKGNSQKKEKRELRINQSNV